MLAAGRLRPCRPGVRPIAVAQAWLLGLRILAQREGLICPLGLPCASLQWPLQVASFWLCSPPGAPIAATARSSPRILLPPSSYSRKHAHQHNRDAQLLQTLATLAAAHRAITSP